MTYPWPSLARVAQPDVDAPIGIFDSGYGGLTVARAVIDEFFGSRRPSLTVIVPSYQEDARVIRMTLLSAALQDVPAG